MRRPATAPDIRVNRLHPHDEDSVLAKHVAFAERSEHVTLSCRRLRIQCAWRSPAFVALAAERIRLARLGVVETPVLEGTTETAPSAGLQRRRAASSSPTPRASQTLLAPGTDWDSSATSQQYCRLSSLGAGLAPADTLRAHFARSFCWSTCWLSLTTLLFLLPSARHSPPAAGCCVLLCLLAAYCAAGATRNAAWTLAPALACSVSITAALTVSAAASSSVASFVLGPHFSLALTWSALHLPTRCVVLPETLRCAAAAAVLCACAGASLVWAGLACGCAWLLALYATGLFHSRLFDARFLPPSFTAVVAVGDGSWQRGSPAAAIASRLCARLVSHVDAATFVCSSGPPLDALVHTAFAAAVGAHRLVFDPGSGVDAACFKLNALITLSAALAVLFKRQCSAAELSLLARRLDVPPPSARPARPAPPRPRASRAGGAKPSPGESTATPEAEKAVCASAIIELVALFPHLEAAAFVLLTPDEDARGRGGRWAWRMSHAEVGGPSLQHASAMRAALPEAFCEDGDAPCASRGGSLDAPNAAAAAAAGNRRPSRPSIAQYRLSRPSVVASGGRGASASYMLPRGAYIADSSDFSAGVEAFSDWSALVHPPPPQPSPHPATSPLRARASWTAASLAAAPVAAPAAAPAVASLAAAAPVAVAVTAAVSCGDVVFGYVLLSFSHRLGFAAATTGEASPHEALARKCASFGAAVSHARSTASGFVLASSLALARDVFPAHLVDARLRRNASSGHAVDGGGGWEACAQQHECLTIIFVDVVGSTSLASGRSCAATFALMHQLWSAADALSLSPRHPVYKIETVGDAYVAVAGFLPPVPDHARAALRFSLALHEAASCVALDPDDPSQGHIRLRIGLHSGPIMSGIVGSLRTRFCIFGDSVNVAARVEASAAAGAVQMSQETHDLLQLPPSADVPWATLDLKGKGATRVYSLVAGSDEANAVLTALAEDGGG